MGNYHVIGYCYSRYTFRLSTHSVARIRESRQHLGCGGHDCDTAQLFYSPDGTVGRASLLPN